jgi:hypothetical protein
MEESEYKRFLNFLRKHDCQVSFKEYRRYGDDTDRRLRAESVAAPDSPPFR